MTIKGGVVFCHNKPLEITNIYERRRDLCIKRDGFYVGFPSFSLVLEKYRQKNRDHKIQSRMIPNTNLGLITQNFGEIGIFGDMTTKTHFSANQGQDINKSVVKGNYDIYEKSDKITI